MIYTIKNDFITVDINSKGAELWSIKTPDNTEYLWQGDATFWKNRATNIFPYIGRMTEGKYTYKGETYEMGIHGFAKDSEFNAEVVSDEEIMFTLQTSDETLSMFPFDFKLYIHYKLNENTIEQTYKVENRDWKKMYFGIGGHPGFNLPLNEGLAFEDYKLVFETPCEPDMLNLSATRFVSEGSTKLELVDGVTLNLQHNLFDNDAMLLKNTSKKIKLMSDKGEKGVEVTFKDMDYLALWHAPETTAPYVCIEPWSSTQSRHEVIEDFETQPGLMSLESCGTYVNTITIKII